MTQCAFTGIVLAGGRSSRMGHDKALLSIDGHTLLDGAIAILRAAGAGRVLVSGDRPSHDGVPDDVPALGPVGGLASVLAHCPDGPVVAVPVDMPRLDVDALTRLRDALGPARAAHYGGHPLPCALLVDARVRTTIDALIAANPAGPSLHALLHGLAATTLPVREPRLLVNLNTPADWAAHRP